MSNNELSDRLLSITGHTADLGEALDEFENVKEAVAELHDENQALEILNRRLRLCLELAGRVIEETEQQAGMFIAPKTREKIEQFREQVKKAGNTIVQSKLIAGKQL